MKSHEVLRMVLKKYGFKRASAELKLALAYLYNWCNPDGGKANGSLNPLERILSLIQITGDLRPLHWLCAQCGGFFVKNPTPQPVAGELLPSVCEVEQKFMATLQSLVEAAAKGHITPAEMAVIRARWEEQKSAMEGFLQGTFRCGQLSLHGTFPACRRCVHARRGGGTGAGGRVFPDRQSFRTDTD